MADFLGFWGVKKPATVSRAVSKLYPYGQKKSPGTRAGACISASSSGVCWNRCGYIHPAISTALGLTPPSRGYSRASMISSLIRCFSSLSSAVARLRLSRSMSVCIAVASANSQGVSDIPFRRAARAQGRFLVVPAFDTITVSVADAPRPEEILVVMAIADGGRLRNRCGTEPIR